MIFTNGSFTETSFIKTGFVIPAATILEFKHGSVADLRKRALSAAYGGDLSVEFSQHKMLFPSTNFHLCRPKTNSSVFKN